jgi:hypothetical protein
MFEQQCSSVESADQPRLSSDQAGRALLELAGRPSFKNTVGFSGFTIPEDIFLSKGRRTPF